MNKGINILVILFFVIIAGCKDDKRYHDEKAMLGEIEQQDPISDIIQFQNELNEQFRDPERSPLTESDRKKFDGLEFFMPDTNYRVMADLKRTPEALPFLMPTTTSRKARERVYGIASFMIDGQSFELEIYQSMDLIDDEEYEDYLFLPYTDLTNGNGSYEGGRYIDLEIPDGDLILIDFNKSYNPYCHYNKKYSCPIVPKVNHLKTEISAGVKAFK